MRTKVNLLAGMIVLTATCMPAAAHASHNFTGPHDFGAGTGPFSIAVGDFDADSDPAVANQDSNDVSILLAGAPPEISLDGVSQAEGDSGDTTYTFTATRTGNLAGTSHVSYETADGSATTADGDYQAASGSLSFGIGETTKTFEVTVNGDTDFEPDEQFKLKLTDPVGATLADDEGTGTILNDDTKTVTFPVEADARVEEDHRHTNYGSSTALGADRDEQVESHLRFALGEIEGSIKSAKLRLHATSSTANGPAAHKADWTSAENAITWANRPPRTSAATDNKGAIGSNTFVEWELKSLVSGNGAHSFVLVADSSDGVDFSSREVTDPAKRPVLVVTFGPDLYAPSTPANLSAKAPGSQRVGLRWAAATDNFGVTAHKVYRDGNLLATIGPATSYSDTSVVAGETYDYEVTALDAAGHESDRSDVATATTPLIFRAVDDARVEERNPGTNFGTSSLLRTDAGSDPGVQSYLRFNLTGISSAVQKAVLQLYATSRTSNGPAAFATDNSWSESGITWNNRPAPTTGQLFDVGAIGSNRYVEWDVTAFVTGNGTYNFVLIGVSSDGVNFNSRETSLVSRRPRLFVTR